jgi:hypothetical protein
MKFLHRLFSATAIVGGGIVCAVIKLSTLLVEPDRILDIEAASLTTSMPTIATAMQSVRHATRSLRSAARRCAAQGEAVEPGGRGQLLRSKSQYKCSDRWVRRGEQRRRFLRGRSEPSGGRDPVSREALVQCAQGRFRW